MPNTQPITVELKNIIFNYYHHNSTFYLLFLAKLFLVHVRYQIWDKLASLQHNPHVRFQTCLCIRYFDKADVSTILFFERERCSREFFRERWPDFDHKDTVNVV